MRTTLISILVLSSLSLTAQKRAYKLYNGKGNSVNYTQMLEKVKTADVVLFGEEHNNVICHWMQLELTRDLYTHKKDKLIIGAEMFEADNQLIINEYLEGLVPEAKIKEARLWDNYETDYKPLLEFAKKHELRFIATNIPRRYASAVYRKGGFPALEKLSDKAKQYIAPLPIEYNDELTVYKQMTESMPMMGKPMHGGKKIKNLPKSQAIKDATMAHFISQNYKENHLFLHYNGRLHSDYKEGIAWYLEKYAPELKVMTISTRKQKDISSLEKEAKNIADFVLVVTASMTNSY